MIIFDSGNAADRIPFTGYHMPFPGVGYIEEIDGGFRYVPASYQLDLQVARPPR
ncbi:MAG: hypothetical protein R3F54_28455 [Alphaproteobacteria bacterium]